MRPYLSHQPDAVKEDAMASKSKWIEMDRNVLYVQAANCLFCLHIGNTAIFVGVGAGGYGARLELFTDMRWFRFRRRISA
jgi:hypothetical protein